MRHVIVSGGGTGIGRAIARAFAELGDQVLILGRREAVLEETASAINAELGRQSVRSTSVDLTDPQAVEQLQLPEYVDVLINNAGGVARDQDNSLAGVAEGLHADIDQNLLTAQLLTAVAQPRLTRPGGRVINVSSIAALRGGGDSYAASKAAVIGWSYTLASDLGPEGITVNVIAPGFIDDTEFFAGTMDDERRTRLIHDTLIKRAGAPVDVAGAAVYLASAGYVTGQVLQVNGGALLGHG